VDSKDDKPEFRKDDKEQQEIDEKSQQLRSIPSFSVAGLFPFELFLIHWDILYLCMWHINPYIVSQQIFLSIHFGITQHEFFSTYVANQIVFSLHMLRAYILSCLMI